MLWMVGSENLTVNEISETSANHDLQTPESFFQLLLNILGKCTMTNLQTTTTPKPKTSVLNTRKTNLDVFSASYSEENYLVPRIYQIAEVINHNKRCHSAGVLVMRFWPSFWL